MRQIMENEWLRVEIEDRGAELARIYDKEKDREVLWTADPAYWGWHAPVLFPNVGRHYGDTYRLGGVSYPSVQHGLARRLDFTCVEAKPLEVVHQLLSTEDTRKTYPFDFVFRVRHVLEGRSLMVFWEVKNPNTCDMFFTIGGHPGFCLPAQGYEQCRLQFDSSDPSDELSADKKKSLTYYLITPDGSGTVDKAHPYTLSLENGSCALGALKDGERVLAEHFFDKDALVFDGGQIEKVSLVLPDGSIFVEVTAKDFPNFGIWAAPGAPFACLEPWMGRADDTGYAGELSEKPGIIRLGSADTFRKSYTIRVA